MVRASVIPALALLASSAAAEGTSDQLGFGYCPPPVIPSCIDDAARHSDAASMAPCSRDVLRFTHALGAYRACLTRESERAIGAGNAAIARFRCLSQHGTRCR